MNYKLFDYFTKNTAIYTEIMNLDYMYVVAWAILWMVCNLSRWAVFTTMSMNLKRKSEGLKVKNVTKLETTKFLQEVYD